MAFIQDSFSATGGTSTPPRINLPAHVGDTGHSWDAPTQIGIRTDQQVAIDQTGQSIYRHAAASIAPPSADYSVKVDVTVLTTADYTAAGPQARISGVDRDSGYVAVVDPNAQHIILEEFSGGAHVQLGAAYDISGLLGALPATLSGVEIRCIGNQISVLLNGSIIIGPVTDNTHTAAGKAGFLIRATTGMADVSLDNFEASGAGPSVTVDGDLQPGASFTLTASNFDSAPVSPATITDSNGNSITVAVSITDNGGGSYTATGTMPALPSSGTATGLLFGTVTIDLSTS